MRSRTLQYLTITCRNSESGHLWRLAVTSRDLPQFCCHLHTLCRIQRLIDTALITDNNYGALLTLLLWDLLTLLTQWHNILFYTLHYHSTKPIVDRKVLLKRFLGWYKHCDVTLSTGHVMQNWPRFLHLEITRTYIKVLCSCLACRTQMNSILSLMSCAT